MVAGVVSFRFVLFCLFCFVLFLLRCFLLFVLLDERLLFLWPVTIVLVNDYNAGWPRVLVDLPYLVGFLRVSTLLLVDERRVRESATPTRNDEILWVLLTDLIYEK